MGSPDYTLTEDIYSNNNEEAEYNKIVEYSTSLVLCDDGILEGNSLNAIGDLLCHAQSKYNKQPEMETIYENANKRHKSSGNPARRLSYHQTHTRLTLMTNLHILLRMGYTIVNH